MAMDCHDVDLVVVGAGKLLAAHNSLYDTVQLLMCVDLQVFVA